MDNNILIGYISCIEKHKFYAIFERKFNSSLELEQKIKKINENQKENLVLGTILKLDFNDNKLYFLNNNKQWI